jgi:hypothetical protein
MNVTIRPLVATILLAGAVVGLHAQVAKPQTNAQLLAKVAALQQEIAGLKNDYGILLTTCQSAPPPTGRPTTIARAPTVATAPTLDRQKFDKVYAAGKAVDGAKYLSAVGVTPRQFQQLLLAFTTEISIVSDKATTEAESSLAGQYQLAQLQFDLLLAESADPRLRYNGTMEKATDTLDAANKIYLGK